MKRIIKSGKDQNPRVVIEIILESNKILSDSNEDAFLDNKITRSKQKWRILADHTISYMQELGFDVDIEASHPSDRSKTSYYITGIHKATGLTIEVVLYIRLSDHTETWCKQAVKKRNKYNQAQANERKKQHPNQIGHIGDEIYIDRKECKTYRDALDVIKRKLDEFKK